MRSLYSEFLSELKWRHRDGESLPQFFLPLRSHAVNHDVMTSIGFDHVFPICVLLFGSSSIRFESQVVHRSEDAETCRSWEQHSPLDETSCATKRLVQCLRGLRVEQTQRTCRGTEMSQTKHNVLHDAEQRQECEPIGHTHIQACSHRLQVVHTTFLKRRRTRTTIDCGDDS